MARTSSFALLAILVALSPAVHASPLLPRQDAITPLTPSEIAAFKPYTWYASTVACNLSAIMEWNCGEKCSANPTFKPIATGGDGDLTQFWYAGYDPTLDTVIVAHQGTDASKLLPVLTDLDILQVNLDPTLFPGIDKSVLVHQGIAGTHSRSAPEVIAAVQNALSLYPTKNVTAVGHSLGATIALLDATYLPLHLPSDVTVSYRGYALPRVGNKASADYFDSLGVSATRVNNKEDPVPVLPLFPSSNTTTSAARSTSGMITCGFRAPARTTRATNAAPAMSLSQTSTLLSTLGPSMEYLLECVELSELNKGLATIL